LVAISALSSLQFFDVLGEWQEQQVVRKKSVLLIPAGYLAVQIEEENLRSHVTSSPEKNYC